MKSLRNSPSLRSMCPTLTQPLIHSTRLILKMWVSTCIYLSVCSSSSSSSCSFWLIAFYQLIVFRYLKCLERVKARGSNRFPNCPIANCSGTAPALPMWLVSFRRVCVLLLLKLQSRVSCYQQTRIHFVALTISQNRLLPSILGYMFGKGIYFADMVSKSANYCMTSKANPTGFLLLADVALGKW